MSHLQDDRDALVELSFWLNVRFVLSCFIVDVHISHT